LPVIRGALGSGQFRFTGTTSSGEERDIPPRLAATALIDIEENVISLPGGGASWHGVTVERITAELLDAAPADGSLRLLAPPGEAWSGQAPERTGAEDAPQSAAHAQADAPENGPERQPPSPADYTAIPNKPGNGGRKLEAAIHAMVTAVDCGRVTFSDLRRMKQKALEGLYPDARRTLLVQARKVALEQLATRGHSDKAAT
jgi:hypothetical protein